MQENGTDFSYRKVLCIYGLFAGFLERRGIVNWKMGLRWKILQKAAAAPRSVEVLTLSTGMILCLAHCHGRHATAEKHWQLSHTHTYIQHLLHVLLLAETWLLLKRYNPLQKKRQIVGFIVMKLAQNEIICDILYLLLQQ